MNEFLAMSDERRKQLCIQTGAKLNLAEVAVEKDFWVCWTLDKLFHLPVWGDQLVFKGGTSLSKGWGLIARFSEDIDIVINRQALGFAGDAAPEAAGSRKQTKKRLDALREACRSCVRVNIRSGLLEALTADIPSALIWELLEDPVDHDGQTLLFNYPTVFPFEAAYLRRGVKIEMGARSDTEPCEKILVSPYIIDTFPALFSATKIPLRAVKPKRTFWEKAMLLHEENCRAAGDHRRKKQIARHYYDLYRLIEAGVASEALADSALFASVARHRAIFFHQNWMNYNTLARGHLRLIPDDDQLPEWRSDYNDMQREMFFDEKPDFEKVMAAIRKFQDEFNR
jgi:hypothetical protein